MDVPRPPALAGRHRLATGKAGVDARLMRLAGFQLQMAALRAGAHGFTSANGVARTARPSWSPNVVLAG